MARRSVNRYFEGLLAGGTIGIVIGLLSARKPGNEFRKDLKRFYDDLSKTALDSYKELQETWIDDNSSVETIVERGKDLVDNFMGNNSGPVYRANAQKTGTSS